MKLLRLVPADNARPGPNVFMVDYPALYASANYTITSREDLVELFMDGWGIQTPEAVLMEALRATTCGHADLFIPISKQNVGYDLADVTAEIQFAGGLIALGNFDARATENALNNQTAWPQRIRENYRTEEYKGVTIHFWDGGDYPFPEDKYKPPHLSSVGKAKPLAVMDKYLFYGISPGVIKVSIDACRKSIATLDTLREYALVTQKLADSKTFKALLGMPGGVSHDATGPNAVVPLLKNYLVYGIGIGRDESGYFSTVLLYHESPELARENVPLLKQRIDNCVNSECPWRDIITSTEVSTDGNLLIAKLYVKSYRFWNKVIQISQPLIWAEEPSSPAQQE